MFKKIAFTGLNYKDLERFESHDFKRDEMTSFYQTFDFLELIKEWPQIVGEKLAPYTSPLRLRQDSLFIITKHSIYSQELSFLSEEIKGEIFKVFPRLKHIIKKLVFQTQESFFEQQKLKMQKIETQTQKLHPQSPRYKLLKLEAERFFSDIEDPTMKEMFISIFIQSKLEQ